MQRSSVGWAANLTQVSWLTAASPLQTVFSLWRCGPVLRQAKGLSSVTEHLLDTPKAPGSVMGFSNERFSSRR